MDIFGMGASWGGYESKTDLAEGFERLNCACNA